MTIDNTPTAKLIELFSAIQGEGLNVGTRQILFALRFAISVATSATVLILGNPRTVVKLNKPPENEIL